MADVDDLRAVWDIEPLRGLWEKARETLESPRQDATFRLELPDAETRDAVGSLVGRKMMGHGTRIKLTTLDERVRATRFRLSLEEVLEILHGRPVIRRTSESAERNARRERLTETVRAALAEQSVSGGWTDAWIRWIHQYGRIADEDLPGIARRAASVLARLALEAEPEVWHSRADLAARVGGAHQLDNGMPLSRVVLRAAALARGVAAPGNERERRELWERCGVVLDGVSATALTWALPLVGDDPWSRSVRQRTELGLPAHLMHLDLAAAPERLVEPGTTIAVCENPRILEATAQEEIRHPLVCVSGNPTTVTLALLGRLASNGARLRYHGDFDWPGLRIAGAAMKHAEPWRMSAADYRQALDEAARDRIDLPSLVGEPVPTPWDPALAELMANTGRAVEEEAVLPTLLADLRAGLG
ncbi:TIGR02679 family protein [Saccharopolyspora taberi]|uniref:TIGR02679 family protein n=1 Tax=Saccharopolyspora taberi TaxID=60895 RepID=A0ABN3V3V8_9PSEU